MTPGWWRIGRLALGIAVLVLVVASVNPAEVASGLAGADLRLAVPAILGLVAMHAVAAAGWRWILSVSAEVGLPWGSALRAYYAAQAVGGLTPANAGGDVHRALALRAAGHGWSAAVAPIVIQRATSYLALSLLSLAGLLWLASGSELALGLVLVGLAVAAAVGVAAWILVSPPRRLRAALMRAIGDGAGRTPSPPLPRRRLGAAALIGVGQGLLFHGGSVALTWVLVLAVDPASAGLPVVAALLVARLSLAIPLSPSGLGLQEGALAVLVAGLGMAPHAALAGLLLARLSMLLTTVLGAALVIAGPPRLPSPPGAIGLHGMEPN